MRLMSLLADYNAHNKMPWFCDKLIQDATLSQGEPTQWHHAVSLAQHGFLV